MKKPLDLIVYAFILALLLILVYINIRLHTLPKTEDTRDTKQDVVLQLNFLEQELKTKNLGAKTQDLYPEGFIFINALYGLTWVELAFDEKEGSDLHYRALLEARYAYKEIDSEYGKSIFDDRLKPEFGIFYRGWKNFLLAKIVYLQDTKDSTEVAEFTANCDSIASAISQSKSPFLESYWGASWPADAFVAVASLKQHDLIFEPKYTEVIQNWLIKVKAHLDPKTGLIPHAVNSVTGKTEVGARGSSICLILIFLADIDPEFAEEQFNLFQKEFPITRFGFLAVKEYPDGTIGNGDADSGPVVWDMGFAGTVVATGTFKKFGEYNAADKISGCIEAFGFALSAGEQKKYLFGKLPITDAFFAWARIQVPNTTIIQSKGRNTVDKGSYFIFHLTTAVTVFLVVFIMFRKSKNPN